MLVQTDASSCRRRCKSQTDGWRWVRWRFPVTAIGDIRIGVRCSQLTDALRSSTIFADDLKQIYTDESIQTIASLNLTLHAAVVDFLDLDIETVVIDNKNDLAASDAFNLRDGVMTEQTLEPYYQIWSSKFGFQPHQSILDLLFNVGREAVFVLRNA